MITRQARCWLGAALPLTLLASPLAGQRNTSTLVAFRGQSVDVGPLLAARRFSDWHVDEAGGRLFYLSAPAPRDAGSERDPRTLFVLPLQSGQPLDPTTGRRLATFGPELEEIHALVPVAGLPAVVIAGGAARSDVIALNRVSFGDGTTRPLTRDSITAVALATFPVAYVTPHPATGDRYCLKRLDVATAAVTRTMCDALPGYTLRPCALVASPDGRGVALPVAREVTGKVANAIYVDWFADPAAAPALLFPSDTVLAENLNTWPRLRELRYWHQGADGWSIRAYDRQTGQSAPVRAETGQLLVEVNGRTLAVQATESREIAGTTLRFQDPLSGRELGSWYSEAPLQLHPWGRNGAGQGRLLATFANTTTPLWADELTVTLAGDRPQVRLRPLLRPGAATTALTERCLVTPVRVPTWDTDPRTGMRRRLSGHLYEPTAPSPDPADRVALNLAYYGGGKSFGSVYNPTALSMCALGVTFLSAAIRDVQGAGDELVTALTTADPLVGEVRDVAYAARFLEQRLGLRPEQIGVFGGSHGGGTTIRALTALRAGVGFPDDERYRFAFGIAISPGDKPGVFDPRSRFYQRDRRYFAQVLADTAALRARLPFTRVELLEVPLLILQATEDPTVSIAATRRHVRDAQARGLPAELVEFPGEGHNFGRVRNSAALLRAQLAFIERVTREHHETGGRPPRGALPRDTTARARLQLLFTSWERRAADRPVPTTRVVGGRPAKWVSETPEVVEARRLALEAELAAIRSIDRAALPPDDQLEYDLFLYQAQRGVELRSFPWEVMPVYLRTGVHRSAGAIASMPARTVTEYEEILAWLNGVPFRIDEDLAWMRQGLATGVTPPRVLLRDEADAIRAHVDATPLASPYLRAFTRFPASIPPAEQERLRTEAVRLYEERIRPAYQRFHRYFAEEYLPRTREDLRITALPRGREWYAERIRFSTSLDLTPEEVHQIGLARIRQIHAGIDSVQQTLGFRGSFQEFARHVATDPQFVIRDPRVLIRAIRETSKRAEPELFKLFREVPRLLPSGVVAAPNMLLGRGHMEPGSWEARRPSLYYVGTDTAGRFWTWAVLPMTLHGMHPGHLTEDSWTAEASANWPTFRKRSHFGAMSQGWPAYAVSLADEMGLIETPYDRLALLYFELQRALPLVVQTGLLWYGWSPEEAARYYRENGLTNQHYTVTDLDRLIAYPGSDITDIIGLRALEQLRERAERELGRHFDLRDFNQALRMRIGIVPLPILERHMDAWLAAQRRAAGR